MAKEQLDAMLKAQQWERAKGELRAFVAMQGSYIAGTGMMEIWENAEAAVDTFIEKFESEGLHE